MDGIKRRHNAVGCGVNGMNNDTFNVQPTLTSIESSHYAKPQKLSFPSINTLLQHFANKHAAYYHRYHHLILPTILTAISFWTRFRLINLSKKVVWDEAHFGKFGSHYLKHDFYFDVHPPLGKMLVGLSGFLAGYDGSFGFKSGTSYPDDMDYGLMRAFNAMWGALLVPLAYLTARQLRMSVKASTLASMMVLLDTALLCISRFILLDSMLLFFTSTSLYCLSKFHHLKKNGSFSKEWYLWLFMTGLSLGCVSSVKWVGLFAVALVGLDTIEDLWIKLGDLDIPKQIYAKHLVARLLCLMVVPLMVYLASFALHFALLYKSGDGDGKMSSLFQATLEGNTFDQNPLELAYGSKLTLKNYGYGGGLLHSHVQRFPKGSKQQQVTCYHHKDQNNQWIIKTPRNGRIGDYENDNDIRLVRNGDVIRLMHVSTGANLHSHPVKAPMTTEQWEVSGYGNETLGDIQDNWKVEVVTNGGGPDGVVRSLTTQFRLRHVQQGCLLTANNVILPPWGFKQVEVHCDKRNRINDPHTWWNVEEHRNEKLQPAPSNTYKSPFLQDFWHLNVAMWSSNKAMVPDPDKLDILSSKPTEWPMATVGLRMCGWDKKTIKFYLLGNPIVWWTSFLSILLFLASVLVYAIRMQRKIYDLTNAQWDHFLYVGKTLFLGWLLHYLPFFIMGRVRYLHHYFPSLYFSLFMVPFLLDHFTQMYSSRTQWLVFGLFYVSLVGVFIYFSPLVYGMTGPVSHFAGRKWLTTWNIVD